MNTLFNRFLKDPVFISVTLIFLFSLLLNSQAQAEPYLAMRANQKCSACHVNPLGGGARTSFGAYYGSQVLPASAGDASSMDAGQITELLRIGGDLRVNLNTSSNDANEDARGFNTQSGQIYITIQPKNSPFTLYFDEQIAPGGTLNREAWIKAKLGKSNHYVKAGTMMLPFGYRFEDDDIFGREASRVTFDSNDTGVELGLEYAKGSINFAVTNGSPSSNNPDTKFAYATRAEYVGNNFRGGVSFLLNETEQAGIDGESNMFAVFGGFNLWGFTVLSEFDSVAEELGGDEVTQEAFLVSINREVKKGYNLKLMLEQLDPNTDVDNDERTRNSLLLEATPWAYVQMRAGLRLYEDIPQLESGSGEEAFFQLHLYY